MIGSNERVALTQPAIARLEGGEVKNVELKTLVKVAAALGARVKITFEKYDQEATVAKGKRPRNAEASD